MRKLTDTQYLLSASDLTAFINCEFAFLRRLDVLLGLCENEPDDRTPLTDYAAKLGFAHEARQLAAYKKAYPGKVVEIAAPERESAEAGFIVAREKTFAALKNPETKVVFQATFYEAPVKTANDIAFGFLGFADFIVRDSAGSWQVQDTKLTATAKVTALMQLAAYADKLVTAGLKVADTVELLHGNNTVSSHELRDINPFYKKLNAKMRKRLSSRILGVLAGEITAPVALNDESINACLRCPSCMTEAAAKDDLITVFGVTKQLRKQLTAAGVTTARQLAASKQAAQEGKILLPAVAPQRLLQLTEQAELQTEKPQQKIAEQHTADINPAESLLNHRFFNPAALNTLSKQLPNDIFLSIHRNTLYLDKQGNTGCTVAAALAQNGKITVLHAHDIASERELFLKLLETFKQTLETDRNARIYHFGRAVRAQLASLGSRHRQQFFHVPWLLTSSNVVDLQQLAKDSLQIGAADYELKTLTGLWKQESAETAADNAQAVVIDTPEELVIAHSQLPQAANDQKARLQAAISDFMQTEVQQLQALYEFLAQQKRALGLPETQIPAHYFEFDENARERLAAETQARKNLKDYFYSVRQQLNKPEYAQISLAFEMLGAAFDYHRRERLNADEALYWWLNTAPEHWGASRETVLITEHTLQTSPWSRAARGGMWRTLKFSGECAQQEPFRVGDSVRLMYAPPAPPEAYMAGASGRWIQHAKVQPVQLSAQPEASLTSLTEQSADFETAPPETAPAETVSLETGTKNTPDKPDKLDKTVQLCVQENIKYGAAPYSAKPIAVLPGAPISTKTLQESLMVWAKDLAAKLPETADPTAIAAVKDAGWQLLLRAKPRLKNNLPLPQADSPETLAYASQHGLEPKIAAIALAVSELDYSVIPVQGPPGAGKSYVASRVIKHLVAKGWKIGIVSQSHAVVEHLLSQVVKAGVAKTHVLKPRDSKQPAAHYKNTEFTAVGSAKELGFALQVAQSTGQGLVLGGTAWTFSNQRIFNAGALDLLVVDEGGQFGMVQALAALRTAKNLLLVGDPQQLPQVSQGEHPVPVNDSALGWLMQGEATVTPEQGFFLAESWRMCAPLCAVVSELSYDGKLRSAAVDRAELRGWFSRGLHYHPVSHTDNSTESIAEAQAIAGLCKQALSSAEVATPRGFVPLQQRDIIVVAPYNAQVSRLREALAAVGLYEVRVGTVDRFQGQEAQLAFVSMTASNVQDNPRGIEFLLNRNRLNVAISRAKWAAHIVASPQLHETMPQTAGELKSLAGFLRLTANAGSQPL